MTNKLSDTEKMYINAFWLCQRMNGDRLQIINKEFETYQEAWERLTVSNLSKHKVKADSAQAIIDAMSKIDPSAEWQKLQKYQIQMLVKGEPDYPQLLAEIHTPPAVLYMIGSLPKPSLKSVAIVGSRSPSSYGRQVVDQFSRALAQSEVVIVSGLALGIDALAHQGTVATGGHAIAVLGNGLDKIYPASNASLAKEILKQGGAIISEFPLGTPPLRQNFPARNRIISGLANGTLIIEAAESSGTLITAAFALEQNREVWAVPGSIYSEKSLGTNNLIKKTSAIPVNAPDDILDTLEINKSEHSKKVIKLDTENEQKIYDLIGHESKPSDELVRESELPAATVSATLTLLELKGYIKNLGGGRWVLG